MSPIPKETKYEINTLFELMNPSPKASIQKKEEKKKISIDYEFKIMCKGFESGRFSVMDITSKKIQIDTSKLRYINENEKPFTKIVMTKGRFKIYE